MKFPLTLLGTILVLLAIAPALHAKEQKSQLSYWAPGTINRVEGTVEMDVAFLNPRSSLLNGWDFLFRVRGNSVSAGTTILGMVLCPPSDGRDFVALARGRGHSANIDVTTPDYELTRPHRISMSWGQGQMSLWFDGKLLGREALRGELSLLPEKFFAGLDSYSGFSASFRVKQLRISDVARSSKVLRSPVPLVEDEHSTLLLGEGGKVIPTDSTVWQTETFASAIFPIRSEGSLVTSVGKSLVQPLCLVNFTSASKTFNLSIRVNDRAGSLVAVKEYTLTVPAEAQYQLSEIVLPAMDQSGYYQAALEVRDSAGEVETYELAFVNQVEEGLKPGNLSEYMGHHSAIYSTLGYKWIRAWAYDRMFLWDVVEPAQGAFQWEATDRYVKNSQDEGLQVLGILGYPPAWASTYSPDERDRLKLKPKAKYSNSPARYQPKDLEEWKTYVRAVVTRYHDRVKYWEIYNEVDFHPPAMHASFSGTTEDYLALLKSAHEIIKEIDPFCQVLTSGFSLSKGATDVQMPIDLIKAGGAAHFDIFNVHGYTSKDTIAETVEFVREAKPGVQVWQTERTFMGGAIEDYQVATKCFWMLSQGFSKFFLHGGEMDRDFGELYPNAYFAVAAELARQLRSCDEYLGPVEGLPKSLDSWTLKRSDGSYLQAFAVDNGKLRLRFENAESGVLVTDLYGETLFQGALLPSQSLEVSSMRYIVSASELKVIDSEREFANVLANPSFELRQGDFIRDESLARPVFWDLRPSSASAKLMSFAPGRSGEYALKLKTPAALNRIQTGQVVTLGASGEWNLSAHIKAAPGTEMFVLLKTKQHGKWMNVIDQKITATGDWQKVSGSVDVETSETLGVVLIGLLAENSEMEIDDVELIHLPDPIKLSLDSKHLSELK